MKPTPEEQKAIRLCIRDLRSQDAEIRERGRADAVMLGELVVPVLIRMMSTGGPSSSKLALECLIHIGPAAQSAVRPLLRSKGRVEREVALSMLCAVQDPEAIGELRKLLYRHARSKYTRKGVSRGETAFLTVSLAAFVGSLLMRTLYGVTNSLGYFMLSAHLIRGVADLRGMPLKRDIDHFIAIATKDQLDILVLLLSQPFMPSGWSARPRVPELLEELHPLEFTALDDVIVNLVMRELCLRENDARGRVMDALARVGDARCIPFLKKIIDGRKYTKQPELRERARIALESIRARVETSSMLLRPADAPVELLRPVTIDREQLLRPASDQIEEVRHESNS